MAGVYLWPVCIYGRCVSIAGVYLWPVCIYGRCASMTVVHLWPLCSYDRCAAMTVGIAVQTLKSQSLMNSVVELQE